MSKLKPGESKFLVKGITEKFGEGKMWIIATSQDEAERLARLDHGFIKIQK